MEIMKQKRKNFVVINLITMFFFASTEIVESILPFFLVYSLGASMFIVGMVEGFSEALSNFLKIVGGYVSDFQKKLKVARAGLISILSSLLIFPIVAKWSDIILPIFLKNISEGSFIPARDSFISTNYRSQKARAFSLNRIFENFGELMGIGVVFLYSAFFIEKGYVNLFYFAVILVGFGLMLTFLIREKEVKRVRKKAVLWKIFYPKYLILFCFLSFINFGYSFYIMKVHSQTDDISQSIGLYFLFGIVLIISTFIAGRQFDNLGEARFLKITFLSFSLSHLLIATFPILGFLMMAVSDAMFEIGLWGTLGNRIKYREGFVFGAYHFMVGIVSLISGVFIGYVWDNFGSDIPFILGTVFSLVGYLFLTSNLINLEKG